MLLFSERVTKSLAENILLSFSLYNVIMFRYSILNANVIITCILKTHESSKRFCWEPTEQFPQIPG